jgi:translation initiation factor 1 (eIF-1/SUI1)
MKFHLYRTALISLSLLTSLALAAPAHASILGDNFIKAKIDAGEGNAFQNRDNRNQLLEKMQADTQTQPPTAQDRQNILLEQLSLAISNYQNIRDRISIRATAEATSGHNVSDVKKLLSAASDELTSASSSIASIIASTTSTSTIQIQYDARPAIADVIDSVNSAKNTLQQALDALENII